MLFKILFYCHFAYFSNTNSVYQYSVPKIEGGTQALSVYQGKKLLVVTLPLVQSPSADSLLYSLDTLATAHLSNLKVIATPGYEDGYHPSKKAALRNWYRSKLGNHIIITNGMFTRKTSGSQQHGLFKWLTHAGLNGRFDMDIEAAETKFFVNTDGKIYGVLRPITKMWSRTLNSVINSPIQPEY